MAPTRAPTATAIALADSRIAALESAGYVRAPLAGFSASGIGSSTSFGGLNRTSATQLQQGQYTYLQYVLPSTGNCQLVFVRLSPGNDQVIAVIDVSKLNRRLGAQIAHNDPTGFPAFQCAPMGWGDVNQDGKPDMPVTFIWANYVTGSELHIFEIVDTSTVSDLTQDLPGIISPFDFDPTHTWQTVADLAWVNHDCIYPPLDAFWRYDWIGDRYVDVTARGDYTGDIAALTSEVSQLFGNPFGPAQIKLLTQLLLIYDRSGQRKLGWQKYKEMTSLDHWPGTAASDLSMLKSDLAHFTQEYAAGRPFTPNNACEP